MPAPAGAPGAPGGPDGPGEPGYPRPEWDDDGAPHPARLLLPDRLLPQDRRFTLVVEPLHIGEEQLGFALFDGGPGEGPGEGPDGGAGTGAARRGALYRALGDQISAALKGIRLFDEVRRARDAAEQASRLKTRLLDNATDELRTPVEAILRHTRVPGPGSGTETGTDTGAADALRRAHGDAARLLRLIDDLLDLSRSEIDALDLSRRLLDPRPVLVEAFHGAARHPLLASADRRLALPRRLPAVQADAPRLRQIVLNLLAAAGHLADGGRLRLTAEVLPALLRVRVLATGLRVPPGEAEHLFQPFASGAPGSRLGLAIARRLAALHGGTVALDRGPAGSGFRLDLPLPTPAETAGTAPVPAPRTRSRPGHRPHPPGRRRQRAAPGGHRPRPAAEPAAAPPGPGRRPRLPRRGGRTGRRCLGRRRGPAAGVVGRPAPP
ncbi:HAMP domain-containing histidine kinase [Streptomyces radiopugnans]|nr:HAMP domain-containing histidine kinase [Streptomyces radiopugnans]